MVTIVPEDKKYFVENPKDFNPARNKAIIEETIKETEKFFTELNQLDTEAENRIDILSSYAKYRFNKGTKDFESYAGRELYKRLIGEKILSKVRVLDSAEKLGTKRNILL